MPVRIQRSRAKGWRMPAGTVSVTRPGKYGNPFVIGGWYMRGDLRGPGAPLPLVFTRCSDEKYLDARFTKIETAEQAVEWFRWYCDEIKKTFQELRGKDLACWCKIGACCHADVILERANA